MIKLFFDIETIPCDDEGKQIYFEILKARAEKKQKKLKTGKEIIESEEDQDELYRKTALDGTHGRICSIGIIKEDNTGIITQEVLHGEEKDILEKFWALVKDVNLFIGHNVFGFDFPFIYQRSIINGIKPRELSFARYRSEPIFDTMQEWSKWSFGNSKSLDTLARVLGLPTSKDEMDGSMVWDYFKDGRVEEINKYCMKDVELTRKVYYKMTFQELPKIEVEKNDLPF